MLSARPQLLGDMADRNIDGYTSKARVMMANGKLSVTVSVWFRNAEVIPADLSAFHVELCARTLAGRESERDQLLGTRNRLASSPSLCRGLAVERVERTFPARGLNPQ
jgi:hypothetical protein